jgi:hypothetical protein
MLARLNHRSFLLISYLFSALSQNLPASASPFVPCSFNYQVIRCTSSYGDNSISIIWADGKKQTYYRLPLRNGITFYRDPLGGEWRYLDFAMGKSWSLTNTRNRNVIIWNGTYKEFGSYVGL